MAKIIVLTGTLKQSGSATWAINLTRAFCQEGHDAVLLAMGERGEMALPEDLNTVFLGKSRSHFLVQICHLFQLRKFSRSRYKRLEQWVHSRRVATFLKKFEEKEKTDLVIKDFTTFTPEAISGRKHIAVIHQILSDSDWETDKELQSRAQDKVTAFASVSEASAKDARSKNIPVKGVLYNPVDTTVIKQRANAFTVDDDYIIFVGAMHKNKGVHTLFNAWRQSGMKQKLYYIGRGPELSVLQARVKELGLDNRVKLLGFHANPMPYIKRAKVLVLPSFCYESMGYVAIEALVLKTPVLVSSFSGSSEFYASKYIMQLEPEQTLAERFSLRLNQLLKEQYDFSYADETISKLLPASVVATYQEFLK